MRTAATLAALFVFVWSGAAIRADQPVCPCDYSKPETLGAKGCGLGNLVAKEPQDVPAVIVKDNSPDKPNRWLALPRFQASGLELLGNIPKEKQTALWREAIAQAKAKFGDNWGIATNGYLGRSQCQVHVHMGKLIDGVEWGDFIVVSGPEEIPDPGKLGLWIHPVEGGKLHVHTGEMYTENVLLR